MGKPIRERGLAKYYYQYNLTKYNFLFILGGAQMKRIQCEEKQK
jgi:hypothetical protein